MKLPSIVFLIVCIAVGLAACATPRPNGAVADQRQPDSTAAPLWGTWTWETSAGGKTGKPVTPQSEGYTLTLSFGPDGTFRFERENALVMQGTYAYRAAKGGNPLTYLLGQAPTGRSIVSWATTDSSVTHTVTFPSPNRVMLDEGCCDRYRHTFSRTR